MDSVSSFDASSKAFIKTVQSILFHFGEVAYKTSSPKYSPGDTIKALNMCNLFVFVNDTPKVFNITFNTYVSDSFSIKTDVTIDSSSSEFCFIGSHVHMLPVFAYYFNKYGFEGTFIPQLIDSAITRESFFYPTIVGTPVDIIRITKEKIEWIQKKDSCY